MAERRESLEGSLHPCSAKPDSNVSKDKLAWHPDTKPHNVWHQFPADCSYPWSGTLDNQEPRWPCKWLAGHAHREPKEISRDVRERASSEDVRAFLESSNFLKSRPVWSRLRWVRGT